MAEQSAADLMRELREMDRYLNNMQKDAKRLLDEPVEPDYAEKQKISEEKRRLSSASPWARSTTKKEYPLSKRKNTESGNAVIDVSKAERYVKTRTPEYTFGVRTPRTEDKRDEGHFNGDYDIKVDALSTMKRPKTSTISKTARMDPFGISRPQPPKPEHPQPTDTENEPEAESAPMDEENQPLQPQNQFDDLGLDGQSEAASATEREKPNHEKSGKAFSFGRDKRFVEPKPEPMYLAVADSTVEEGVVVRPVVVPDVERAVKALLPHTTTAVMRPATPLTHRTNTNPTNTNPNNSNITTTTPDIHIDALSYRPRTPTITMRPTTTERKAPVHIDLGTPGPGHYNSYTATTTYTNTTRHTKAAKPVGTLYHTPTIKKILSTNTNTNNKPAPGPGTYVLDQSIAATKHNAPAYTLYNTAESKQTPQMQKKLYFEQKARDLREVHDNMSETNLTQVTTRTPIATLAPPKHSTDPKRDNILTEHRLRNMGGSVRSTSVSRIDSILQGFDSNSAYDSAYSSPNKKFSAVESRVKTGAFMTSEVTARRSTSARIQARPRVAQRVAEDKLAPSGTQRFYGPQIPVPWTKDTLHTNNTSGRTSGAGNRYNDADIVSEVMSIVERNTNPNTNPNPSTNPSTSMLYNTEMNDTEYTAAYLKSRYSGSLQPKKPAIVMQPSKTDDRNIHNKLTIEQQERDYLGPQLQQEWVSNTSNTHTNKNNTLRMDLAPGREIIKQHAKGISEVIRFNHTILPTEEMGPGYYNTTTNTIANANTNNILFDKQISRNDIVGAYGERPISAIDDINTLNSAGEHDIYHDDQIMLDYGTSKDKYIESQKHKNLQLYVKDRHPAPLPPTDDHLGGTHFLGMAHTALQKPGINFAKHSGRADETQEKAILNEIIPLDGSLELDIKDYNPNKGNIIQNVVMTDPKRNPRFVQEKVPTHVNAPTLDPNYDYKYNTENNVVNMEKMKGRIDSDGVYEEGVIEEERVDIAGARALASERDAALRTATLNQQKRTPNAVNMSAQIGRHDNDPHNVDILLNNADNAAPIRYYNDPDQNKPIIEDINRIKGNNAREWSKVPGRDSGGGSDEYNSDARVLGGDVLQQREELVLEPTVDGTTKHKKVQGGVEWTKNADNPRFPGAPMLRVNADGSVVHTEKMLDLGDVDPGKFRAGMAPLGSTSAGPALHTQGRDRGADGTSNTIDPAQRRILDAAGLSPEELILDPPGNPMHKHTTNVTFGSKNNIAGVERTNAVKPRCYFNMSQYKAAMTRLMGGSDTDIQRTSPRPSAKPKADTGNALADYLVDNFDSLINFVIPVIWCLLFVLIMDRYGVFSYWYMPFLGLFAAILCNTVPIGGGVVYVPALSLLGTDMHLGVSFSVAVMTFGNGGLGFMRWLHKDSSLIRWESFRFTVLPSSLGTFLAMVFFPPLEVATVRTLFAYFCLVLAVIVLMAVYRGGSMDNLISNTTTTNNNNTNTSNSAHYTHGGGYTSNDISKVFDYIESNEAFSAEKHYPPRRYTANRNLKVYPPNTNTTNMNSNDDESSLLHDCESNTNNTSNTTNANTNTNNTNTNSEVAEIVKLVDEIPITFPEPTTPLHNTNTNTNTTNDIAVSVSSWYIISLVSFLAGAFLVPNIGIGPALTTFIALQYVGYTPKAAIVTGIITGGWVSIVPFLLHWLWLNDVPFQLWIMVLPGVFYGAKLAPLVHDHIGLSKVLSLFALFLLGTAYLFFH